MIVEEPFFYREKLSALFCCRGRIEIKYKFVLVVVAE